MPDLQPVRSLPLKKHDEFVDFWTWLSAKVGLSAKFFKYSGLPGLAALFGIVYYVIGIAKNLIDRSPATLFSLPDLSDALNYSYLVQIGVIIAILLVYGFSVGIDEDERFPYGTEGQKRLRNWWIVALVSFLLLYIFLWARAPILKGLEDALGAGTNGLKGFVGAAFKVVVNFCNNLSTFAFLMCFLTMESPMKPQKGRDEIEPALRSHGKNKTEGWVIIWVTCLLALRFVEAAVRFRYPLVVSRWNTDWFDLLTGANAGIALAMFCGRLSSPLINPSISVTVPLYFYAVIQFSFGSWANEESVAFVMATMCLVLKCFLSFVIAWLLTTRHLVFYMERMHTTRSQLENWRKEFREVAVVQTKEHIVA